MRERVTGTISKVLAAAVLAAVMTMMFALPVFAGGRSGVYVIVKYYDASTKDDSFDVQVLDPDKQLPLDVYINGVKNYSAKKPFRQDFCRNEYFGVDEPQLSSVSANSVIGLSIPVPDGYSYVKRTVYYKPVHAASPTETEQPAFVRIEKTVGGEISGYLGYGSHSLATWNEERETEDIRLSDAGITGTLADFLRYETEGYEYYGYLDIEMSVYLLKDGDRPYTDNPEEDEDFAPYIDDGRFSDPSKVDTGLYEYEVKMTAGSSITVPEFKKTAGDRSYKITSSKPKVATMTSKGKLSVKSGGCTEIRVTKDDITYIFTVTGVKPAFQKKKFYINTYSDNDETGYAYAGLECQMMKVTYTSSKPDIVSLIDERGNVKGLKRGKAIITADVYGKKYRCTVYVYDPALIGKDAVKVNKKIKLTVKKGHGKTTDWYSSDESVATVSSKGVVKGVSAGEVTIFCKNNGRTLKKTITVEER